ncbi:helix-turn-helix transcriptional regulator [Sphingomonadaceae bacterium G21617-S1]|nr:helix-turn-helix transcriptional regulator [Sphingomonadaceae bacterium G21617-S1]
MSNTISQWEAGGASVSLTDYKWEDGDAPIDHESRETCFRLKLALGERRLSGQIDGGLWERLGPLTVTPAGSKILCQGDGGEVRLIHCRVSDRWLRRVVGGSGVLANIESSRCLNMASPRTRLALRRIGDEMNRPGFAHSRLIGAYLEAALIELARDVRPAQEDHAGQDRLSKAQLAVVEELVRKDAVGKYCVHRIANELGMSPSGLRRKFAATLGQPIGKYLLECRMTKAQALLAANKSVKAVAFEAGYSSTSAFTLAFRRVIGVTPKACRGTVD